MEKQAIHPYPATQPCKGVNVFVPLDHPNYAEAIMRFASALMSMYLTEEAYQVSKAREWTADSEAFPAIGGSVDLAANPE